MASPAESTVTPTHDHCYQTAWILWWMPDLLVVFLLIGGALATFVVLFIASTAINSGLDDFSMEANKSNETQQSEEGVAPGPDPVPTEEATPPITQPDTTRNDSSTATAEDASDTETIVADPPSHDADQESAAMLPKPSKPTLHTSPPQKSPRPSTISGLTPARTRELSYIFMNSTIFTFLIVPSIFSIACLLINNQNFCNNDSPATYPDDLLYMLWITVPGYLIWSYFVVVTWGRLLAMVLGRDNEKEEGAALTKVQLLLAFAVQPALMFTLALMGGLYLVGLKRLYVAAAGAVEKVMVRNQQRDRRYKEDGTALLPLH